MFDEHQMRRFLSAIEQIGDAITDSNVHTAGADRHGSHARSLSGAALCIAEAINHLADSVSDLASQLER